MSCSLQHLSTRTGVHLKLVRDTTSPRGCNLHRSIALVFSCFVVTGVCTIYKHLSELFQSLEHATRNLSSARMPRWPACHIQTLGLQVQAYWIYYISRATCAREMVSPPPCSTDGISSDGARCLFVSDLGKVPPSRRDVVLCQVRPPHIIESII